MQDENHVSHENTECLEKGKCKLKSRELQNQKMSTFGEYIDSVVYCLVTFFIADVLLRFYKALLEYFKYKNHYLPENRFWTILCRAYCYNVATIVVCFCVLLVALVRISFTKHLHLIPPAIYFAYMPLWWLVASVQMGHSTLDNAMFIRGNHGLDSASSMAANFFHGYLKLTLPAYANISGIRERISDYEQTHGVHFAIHRLVILVPNKLFIKSKFDSPYLEKAEPLPKVYLNRAGVYRPYQNDVYRFRMPINNRFYYISLEGATPILTFFETLNFPLTTTKEVEEMQREILLKFYKYLKQLVNKCPDTEEEIEFIFYNESKPNGQKQDIGEMLFNHFEQLILSRQLPNTNETLRESVDDYSLTKN
ncbi:stimulator of interferon genes protein homolog [Zeugodacus cucurbitae]|uniref:stimulator of interferon genes protein homolog n=1 Tax=Zeugodacus cucurbitae TaxID=28588 RepID=UPI0023D90CB9|nr:stimulator of interferon genes protein homolog [Zeugodacus cucurbitae]XP_054089090.1 stimulator of interferon genes protein homolog [Zeugodacus cucurbitae]